MSPHIVSLNSTPFSSVCSAPGTRMLLSKRSQAGLPLPLMSNSKVVLWFHSWAASATFEAHQ